jgi:4-amino-4-deoxy-L-arabinose transferase-like glycosyltransferase
MSGDERENPLTAREFWGVCLTMFLWLAATSGLRLLTLPDEGRYVGVAWEMLRSGDWLTPTLNGMPFFHKPPLFYWITAASLKLFGLHPFAGRVASIIGATLGSLALYVFVRRWGGVRFARSTAMVLLVQPLFYVGAQFANLDMLVAGCISATILLLADAALSVERHQPWRLSLLAAYAVAALGLLAKGLIGFVLPALVIGVWLLIGRRWRTLLRLVSLPGLALFLIIATPWFIAMQQRFPDFLHYFFVVQHFQRFASGGFNNVQPFWFYPAVLLLASLPGLPALVSLMGRTKLQHDGNRGDLCLLMLVWLVCIVAFFSAPQSKLVGYVLPAVAPLACLIADGLQTWSVKAWRVVVGLSMLISVGVVVGLGIHPLKNSRDFAEALSQQARAGEPLFMLKQYAYDLPFYAHLQKPVTVIDDWSDAGRRATDNWRKELADASRFAPFASQQLIESTQLMQALCSASVSYLLGETALVQERWSGLAKAQALASARGDTLWRVKASQLDCPGTPNVGSASK